ncbi:unnamed protein product [Prorocentrum cordatum]|uniref:Uncharacterized protein n=1 Tax=Prorocentrum cordatum TaxID=2364126 RepID=A0ABN9TDD9_9DINO|nr:unnamed protein product [Polarella glacialis]
MRAAGAARCRLAELRRAGARGEGADAEGIKACQDLLPELERLAGDLDGSPHPRRLLGQLEEHRRLVIGSLLEELRDLAGRAQRAQVAKLQHEAEVAGFFTVAAPRGAAVPAPPPMSALSAAGGGDPWAGAAPDAWSGDRLAAEEQAPPPDHGRGRGPDPDHAGQDGGGVVPGWALRNQGSAALREYVRSSTLSSRAFAFGVHVDVVLCFWRGGAGGTPAVLAATARRVLGSLARMDPRRDPRLGLGAHPGGNDRGA